MRIVVSFSPIHGRQETVERVPRWWAAECVERRKEFEEKSGKLGTRGASRLDRCIAQRGNTAWTLSAAEAVQLDLVEIVPNAEPPVCRIMDYGKHVFELKQKQKDAKKKQHQVQIKPY